MGLGGVDRSGVGWSGVECGSGLHGGVFVFASTLIIPKKKTSTQTLTFTIIIST